MSKYLHTTLVCAVALIITACNNGEAEYITRPTPIAITVLTDKMTAGTAQVLLEPEDDRAYFYVECIERSKAYTPSTATLNRDYMILVMDSLYRDYLDWRKYWLKQGERYIAPFSSHVLWYGAQTAHFTNLEPQTEYMVYAFCVNPVSNQPMGNLYYTYFTTDSLHNVDLTFQFSIEQNNLYVMPSDDQTYYICDCIDSDRFQAEYSGSAIGYLNYLIETYKAFGLMDYILMQNAQQMLFFPEPDSRYVLLAAGYDGSLSSHITQQSLYIDKDTVPHFTSME